MGTITLMDGFYIEIEPLNYTLKESYTGKTQDGKDRCGTRIYGYFNDEKGALEKFFKVYRLKEIEGKELSLTEYIKAIEKADKKVMNFLSELGKLEVHHEDS